MQSLDVVVIEDEVHDAEFVVHALQRAGFACTARRVDTEPQLRQELSHRLPDIILSDFRMPRFSGIDALDVARQLCPDIPFIFVSGTIGEDNAIKALKSGATDYVLKHDLGRLAPAVQRALDDAQAITDQRRMLAALQHSELRFRLAASTGDVWDWTIASGQAYISPQWKQRLGYADAEIPNTADAWLALLVPEDRVAVLRAFRFHLRLHQPYDIEYRACAKDGSHRWSHAKGQAVWDETGQATYMAGSVVDITERKNAEFKVKRLNRVYSVMSSIRSLIVHMENREALFRGACQIAVDAGMFRLAWIGLVDASGQRVEVSAWSGAGDDYINYLPLSLIASEAPRFGLVGRVVAQGEPALVQDVAATSHIVLRDEALARGLRSFALLPLPVENKVVGIMALYAGETGFFDEAETLLLQELAGDIAFALDHLAKAEQLKYLAYYDTLTGLPNRELLQDRLDQLLHTLREDGSERGHVSLVWINIDRFNNVSDVLGRQGRDALLKQVAQRLVTVLGATDRLARTGEDLFAAVLTYRGEPAEVARILDDQVLPALRRPFEVDEKELYLTFKVGIALFPMDGADADALFSNAEAASRTAGTAQGRYQFYASSMNDRVSGLLTLESKMHRALANHEFVLHYQPKVDLFDGRPTGMEALIRWNNPGVGLVSPAEFIPVLEETGMIAQVGQWVLEQAIVDHQRWRELGLNPPRVAINVSAVQLRRNDFFSMFENALKKSKDGQSCIDVELTESVFMEDIETIVSRLRAIRGLGVRVAVDDFGTGYSSLSYLTRFPIDYLKIDQSFVRQVTTDPNAAAICNAIIDLAHNLKLKVIAEGVETEAQVSHLRRKHCDEMQGYYFSRPLPADGLAELLRNGAKLRLAPETANERRTLLIVDDETSILSSMRRLLRRDGYDIFTAANAYEGLDVLARHDIQVILSDQRMPEMSGTEFLSRARDLYPDTIRIVLSGYTDLETISDAINRGAIYKFLTKPWDDEALRDSIREAFRHYEVGKRRDSATL